MGGVRDFIGEQNRYELMLAKSMHWDFVDEQSKGSSYDYISPDGSNIEAKFDWDSIKTGNHYLEFSQTSDGGKTWVPSGFSLSEVEADYWVVVNNDWFRMIKIQTLREFLVKNRNKLKITQTRAGVNFNRPGQLSKAYLIPFNLLDEIVIMKTPSPVKKDQVIL
tara:strand:+ start:389 stop:880 length:492 start_codon:yes stop_codon:yes gene_type:complete